MKKEISAILQVDGYKISHKNQYRKGTELVYSTWTPRTSRIEGINKVVTFGIQYFVKDYLIDTFNETFFNRPKEEVIQEFRRVISKYTGEPDVSHWEALHDLGYLPLEIKALEEGTLCPIRVPMLTIQNTLPEFYWLTNFIETIMSTEIWKPMTSATLALEYRKLSEKWAEKTCDNKDHIPFQCHDFSLRGMAGLEGGMSSGAGHLTCFKGTDTIPAILFLEEYYNANSEKELIGCSIPASEHSVQESNILSIADGDIVEGEYLNLKHFIEDVYPTGIFSYVADTYNLWNFITDTMPRLKTEILGRDGKIVVRPDCYDDKTEILTEKGWKLFKDLEQGVDKVAQYHGDGNIDFVLPIKYYNEEYSGDMVHYSNSKGNVDLLVTPNHRMVWQNKKGNITIRKANEKKCTNAQMPCCGHKLGEINNLTPMDKLNIAIQADGRFRCKESSQRFTVDFQFAKQRKIDKLINICKEGGFEYLIKEDSRPLSKLKDNWNDQSTIYVHLNQRPSKTFEEWVDLSDKSAEWCREFIEEVVCWDGTKRTENRYKYDSTIKSNVEIVQKIAILGGYRTKIHSYKDNRSDKYKDIYTLSILKNKTGIDSQAINVETINYKGTVHCVQVPTGMLVVRRNGQVVISGNSGTPEDIICGLNTADKYKEYSNPLWGNKGYKEESCKGVIELLWDIFGGTINSKGYKVLDPHVGCIYGDAITLERAEEICQRLESKGFASSNIVFGVGSYTYNYNTRDTFGFALKTTFSIVNGKEVQLYKDPITDNGVKKSQKGVVAVIRDGSNIKYIDGLDMHTVEEYKDSNLLKTIFKDGRLIRQCSLSEIRSNIDRYIQDAVCEATV